MIATCYDLVSHCCTHRSFGHLRTTTMIWPVCVEGRLRELISFVSFQNRVTMDKVYKQYKDSVKKQTNPQQLMEELGLDGAENDTLGMGVIRKEVDLTNEEKQYLLACERGDLARTKNFLEEAQIYFNININCVDPLGRTALLIAIENENIEMIDTLLSYNVELGDAILHAISEENVEAVELLLQHQAAHKKDLSVGNERTRKIIPYRIFPIIAS